MDCGEARAVGQKGLVQGEWREKKTWAGRKALLDHALGIAIQAQLEKVTWARGRPRPQASTALPR